MIIQAAVSKPDWNSRTSTSYQKNSKPNQKGKSSWQDLGGDYLHFTLYKENKDTMEAISWLAKSLKVQPRSFQFAGTKDRRAVTSQRASVYRVYAERLAAAGRTLRNAKIGNYEYQPNGLQLGELTGNEFIITLRDCEFPATEGSGSDDTIITASKLVQMAIDNLNQKGYINYYGLQRFGTFTTRTDVVGVKMLQGDFKAAVEAILDFSQESLAASQGDKYASEDKSRSLALDQFRKTGEPWPALKDLPGKFSAESNIIRHLGHPDRSNDYYGAMQTLPRNLRLMYVHAYQSLVWNIAASERWKRFGAEVLEGDLVLVGEHKSKQVPAEKDSATSADADGEPIITPAESDPAGTSEDPFTRARALTKQEAESGAYSIFDIVLPTPGYDILYPSNAIKTVYEEIMASDRGGNLDPHDMRRKWKDVSLSGSYRKMLARPSQEVSFEIKNYDDKNADQQFVETDLEKLNKKAQKGDGFHHAKQPAREQEKAQGELPEDEGKEENGEGVAEKEALKMAVVLKLQLGSSQYATMALRELMKEGGCKVYKPDYGLGR